MRRRALLAGLLAPGPVLARRPKPVAGPFRTLDELRASLARSGVPDAQADALSRLARPCAALVSRAAGDRDIPVGASKMGGAPDLPPGLPWPTRAPTTAGDGELDAMRRVDAERNGTVFKDEVARKTALAGRTAPLAFMLQLDLAACAAAGPLDPDIPRTGLLLLFYDYVFQPWNGRDDGGVRLFQLLHIPPGTRLERRTPPDMGFPLAGDDAQGEARNTLPPARLLPTFTWTLPDDSSAPQLAHRGGEQDPWERWLARSPTHLGAANRLGGWPENIQLDAAIDLAAADAGVTLPSGPAFPAAVNRMAPQLARWVMLLQVGDYDNPVLDMNGLYYVHIRRDHLRAGSLDRAQMVYQTD